MSAMLGDLAALGAAFCWAVAPILYRQALFKSNPISANIVRLATNAAVLLLFVMAIGKWSSIASLPPEVLAMAIASGIIGLGIGDTLYLYGLKFTGVSVAVPLGATYPLFTLVWSTFLLGEPVSAVAVVGALVILAGIWLLSRKKKNEAGSVKGKFVLTGAAVSVAAAAVWSVSITMLNVAVNLPGARTFDANLGIVTTRIAAMAMLMLMLAPALDRQRGFLKASRNTVIELCVGGLIANALGWLLMNYSFLNVLEVQAVPVSSTTPLFSALAGFLLFREKATANKIVGAVAVVVGVILIFMI